MLVGERRDQRAQVGEQLARAGVQDVVDADAAGHQVGARRAAGAAGRCSTSRMSEPETDRLSTRQGWPVCAAEFGQRPGRRSRRPGWARRGPARSSRRAPPTAARSRSEDPVVVGLPVAGEGGAVLAHRVDAVGPAAERPGAQPGELRGLGPGHVGGPWWRRSRPASGAGRLPVCPRRSGPGPRPDVTPRASAACSPPIETVDTGQTTLNEHMDSCQRAGIRTAVPPVLRIRRPGDPGHGPATYPGCDDGARLQLCLDKPATGLMTMGHCPAAGSQASVRGVEGSDALLAARLAAGDDRALAEAFDRLARACTAARCACSGTAAPRRMWCRTCSWSCGAIPGRYDPAAGPLRTYLIVLARHRAVDMRAQRAAPGGPAGAHYRLAPRQRTAARPATR